MSKNQNITLQITSKASYAVPMRYDVVGLQAGQSKASYAAPMRYDVVGEQAGQKVIREWKLVISKT